MTILAVANIGIESAHIVNDYAHGRLTGLKAIDRVGRTSASCVATLSFAVKGAALGAAAGTAAIAALPLVGPMVGGVVGSMAINMVSGTVGGMIGNVVGKKIGEVGYDSVRNSLLHIADGMGNAAAGLAEGATFADVFAEQRAWAREKVTGLTDRVLDMMYI